MNANKFKNVFNCLFYKEIKLQTKNLIKIPYLENSLKFLLSLIHPNIYIILSINGKL